MNVATKAPAVGIGALAHAVATLLTRPAFEPRRPHAVGVRYRSGRRGLADVTLPDGPGPHPSVVLVHGGGFVIGSRSMKPVRYLATRLAQAGLASVSFDYRMLFRGGRLDDTVEDVRAAMTWWAESTDRFDLDPTRVSTVGLSAGATAMLLATAPPPIPLHRVVSVFGIYDFATLRGRIPRLLARLLTGSVDPAEWTRRSPVGRSPCPAPLTLLHGDADALTPVAQARAFAARRRALGLPTELHVYPGAPHGFFNDARAPIAERAFADLVAALQ
jgi:acetyl esterase/lipase